MGIKEFSETPAERIQEQCFLFNGLSARMTHHSASLKSFINCPSQHSFSPACAASPLRDSRKGRMHLTVKHCTVQNSKTLGESKNLTLLRTKPREQGRAGRREKQSCTEGVGYQPNSQFFEADLGFPLESTALVSDCNAASESILCSSLHSWRKPGRSWRLK